ncbi:unnamed protein product [Arabidopsis halleri]
MTGVVGDVNQGKRQCWEEIKGKDLCSTRRNECSPRCIKKYPKGGSTCVPTPQGGKNIWDYLVTFTSIYLQTNNESQKEIIPNKKTHSWRCRQKL